jgi:predicted nucleotidyltransferase component of viral defense system
MAFAEIYDRQVSLLVSVLPVVGKESCFALKGGTAINLFVRELPRLSVDIDLAYLPVAPREKSLAEVEKALGRIAEGVRQRLPDAEVTETRLQREGSVYKLVVARHRAHVVIEVTPVLRGCVFESGVRRVQQSVEDKYGFAEISVLSFADLYGGKVVAALDRQHPRDLFDIHVLFENEGLTGNVRAAFIVYLVSHNRPMHEILAPRLRDLKLEFERGLVGMTRDEVDISSLVAARDRLITEAVWQMSPEHKRFLLTFERGTPDWGLLDVARAAELPAIQWRMRNLEVIGAAKRQELVDRLEVALART